VAHGIYLSKTLIKRCLIKAGRVAQRPLTKQLPTKKMKSKRLAWAKEYKNWSLAGWNKVMFTDETDFLSESSILAL